MTIPQRSATGLSSVVEVRFALAGAATFVLVTGCHVLGVDVAAACGLVGVTLILVCLDLPAPWAAALALSSWGLLTGFVVNAGGQLGLAPADAGRAALLVLTAVAASRLGRAHACAAHPPSRSRASSSASCTSSPAWTSGRTSSSADVAGFDLR